MHKGPFPPLPAGDSKSITPNGTTRSYGERHPSIGDAGTKSVGLPTRKGSPPVGNRSGEGNY